MIKPGTKSATDLTVNRWFTINNTLADGVRDGILWKSEQEIPMVAQQPVGQQPGQTAHQADWHGSTELWRSLPAGRVYERGGTVRYRPGRCHGAQWSCQPAGGRRIFSGDRAAAQPGQSLAGQGVKRVSVHFLPNRPIQAGSSKSSKTPQN